MSTFTPKKAKIHKRSSAALYLISQSTGNLAQHLIEVAVSQFPKSDFTVHNRSFCDDAQALSKIKKEIEQDSNVLVFSALTDKRLKTSLAKWCQRQGVQHWDLMQPLIDFISTNTGEKHRRDVSRIHQCDTDYFQRMDALEFTLQHDDNRRIDSLGEADIVLVGVSRVGKTPLSIYLGSLGHKTANVSLTKEQPIPSEVSENRAKTFGLTIEPERLAAIRKRRLELNRFDQALRGHQSSQARSYYSVRRVMDEVLFAEEQFRRLRIPKIDMTDMTIEECAVRILNRLKECN